MPSTTRLWTYNLNKLWLDKAVCFLALFGIFCPQLSAQMIVAEGFSSNVLVNNVLVGDGIETRNISYTGYDRSMALFENGHKAALGIDKGIILSSGVALGSKGPNNDIGYTSGLGGPGNAILEQIAGTKTLDAAVLQFDFKPQTNKIVFNYIFASDEYKEWVDAGFNDIFGFFISGPGISGEQNVALVPGTSIVVSIDNINHKRNTQYFVDNVDVNSREYKYLQPDGLTVSLTANLDLVPCEWYTIKLAIADVGDQLKDSWVFIESKSFKHKTEIGKDTTYCSANFNHTLNAGYPGKSVLWSTGETTQKITVKDFGKYWVEINTGCGSFKDEITILPVIRPISLGNDTFACGNNINFNLEVKNRVFETYLWSTGDTTPTITAKKPGTYWLRVGRGGCFDNDTIEIANKTVPLFNLGNDTFICGNVQMLLTPGVAGDEFMWSDSSTEPYLQANKKGLYWLSLTRNGCNFRDSILLDNRTKFSIDIGPQEITLCENREILLDTRIKDSVGYQIQWSTGDTGRFIKTNKSGKYSVKVSDRRCPFEADDEVSIQILGYAQNYFVPNSFTPNEDGLNDSFQPIFGFSDLQQYHFVIYNKWGQKVFETFDPAVSWDGKWLGKNVEPGVYIWYSSIHTPCLPDHLQYQSGTLTVLK